MKPATKAYYGLFEACARWEKTFQEVLGWACQGNLKLEVGIPFAQTEKGPLAGAVEVKAADIMRMARVDGSAPRIMRVHRVKPKDHDDWVFVSDVDGTPGIEISIGDIFIPADEYRRFEDDNELGPPKRASSSGQSKHDWEGMYVAICKRVFEHGLPETKEALCREMESFFLEVAAETPDISTIRKKVSPVWAALRGAD